jgi:valyl-tRNA synthetase
MVKPAYQHPIDAETLRATVSFLETLLKLLHPFMPFITEELWHELAERGPKDYVCVAHWPKVTVPADSADTLAAMERTLAIVAGVQNVRNKNKIGPTKQVALAVKTDAPAEVQASVGLIRKLANLSDLSFVDAAPASAVGFVQGSTEFFVPLEIQVDAAAERARVAKELEYAIGFRDSVNKKLSNEKFVANAKPDVLERERQKLADAEAKIVALEQALKAL